jgi:hypothetical protein
MHRVHSQVARRALRIGAAPLSDVDRRRRSAGELGGLLPVSHAAPQIVEMAHRDLRQARVRSLTEYMPFAFQNPSRRRSAQPVMGAIHFHQ